MLYAMDRAWWRQHHEEAAAQFQGERICVAEKCFGAQRVRQAKAGNSGAGAIALAALWGAQRVILLGYDCQYGPDGKRHWHGDHPKGLGNAVSQPLWGPQFRRVAGQLVGVDVINASRATALTLWPRMNLESALADERN